MNNLVKILKGTIIGIGAILPGVSGAVIAAAFKVYEELVVALDGFVKHPLKSIKSIWQYLVGIILGVIISYFLVSIIFDYAPLPVTFLFLGLILGEIPQLIKEVKGIKIKPSHIIVSIVSAVLMVGVLFLDPLNLNFEGGIKYLIYALIGVLMALSFIVPGLSGTMLLMALGFYSLFLGIGSDARTYLAENDFKSLFMLTPDLLIVFVGLVVGALLLVKPIHYFLKKKPVHFNYAVLGIVIISPINILFSLKKENEIDILSNPTIKNVFECEWYIWLISCILLVIGFVVGFLFLKKKKDDNEGNALIETEENTRDI